MALIPTIDAGPVSVDQFNAVARALDFAFEALFAGRSPLLWLPLEGSPSWYESRMAGVLYVFGTQANRRLLAATPSHDQAAISQAVVAATILPIREAMTHTLRQVGIFDLNTPGGLARSLQAHQKLVHLVPSAGGDQMYWARTAASFPEGRAPIWHHEHRHTLAVADVVFEGYAPRTFTWPAAYDKFSCVRFHNLDPDPTPLVIMFERPVTVPPDPNPPDTLTLHRWAVYAMRRQVDGAGWNKDGFLLFRARDDDLTRLGVTAPWADRVGAHGIGARPDLHVLWADGANNVASFASMWCWLEYFSRGIPPVVDGGQGGTTLAYNRRTGIWFDPLTSTNPTETQPPLANPADPETPLLKLSTHGGHFLLAEWHGEPPNQTLVIGNYTASFSELLSGHDPSGLHVWNDPDSTHLFLRRMDGAEWWNADFIPISTNLVGSVPIAVPHEPEGVEIAPRGTPKLLDLWRANEETVKEEMYHLAAEGEPVTTLPLDHKILYAEPSTEMTDTGVSLAWTVDDVAKWKFGDGTKDTPHTTFGVSVLAWDGRAYNAAVEASVKPVNGAFFYDTLAGWMAAEHVLNEVGAVLRWKQRDDALTFPNEGGVWMDASVPRLSWPIPPGTIWWHPLAVDAIGEPGGGDWWALPMESAPVSEAGIARLEGPPAAVQADLSTPPMVAQDSTEWIVGNIRTPDWWKNNRDNALAGNLLDKEVRPVIAAPLMHYHYNAFAARLNSISEVVPFSFLDAQWYGTPFREPLGAVGIYGGHTYPTGHLANAPTGSVARQRAGDLGIPLRHFSTTYTSWSGMMASHILATPGLSADSVPYEAFTSFNLLNDLYCWFSPGASIEWGEATGFVQDESQLPPGWAIGNLVADVPQYGYYWARGNNPEAIVPTFDWVSIADVRAKAAELGIPFHVERLSIGYNVHVFMPTFIGGIGIRKPLNYLIPGQHGIFGVRQQAMLVVAPGTSAEFEQVAGRWQADFDPFRWAENGQVRLARWPAFYDEASRGTTDALALESAAALDQAYHRVGVWDEPELGWTRTWWLDPYVLMTAGVPSSGGLYGHYFHGGSFHAGEAPRLRKLVIRDLEHVPVGWAKAPSVLWAAPCPAMQWGDDGLLANPAPGGGFRVLAADALPETISPEDIGPSGWNGRGGWQVSLHAGGLRPIPA